MDPGLNALGAVAGLAVALGFSVGLTAAGPTASGAGGARSLATSVPLAPPPASASCRAQYRSDCFRPSQLRRAYDLEPLYARGFDGRGRTIVIVISFGSPTIREDLHAFDVAFGLPDPELTVLQPAGPVPKYDPQDSTMVGAVGEASLDVEWSHALAPGARIVVVETPTYESEGVTGFPDMVTGERYVLDRGIGDVISESLGATEQTFPTTDALLALRGPLEEAQAKHVSVIASTGDTGAANFELDESTLYPFPTVIWPASDPLVTAVGGTALTLDADGRRLAPDVTWNDAGGASGGGLSTVFPRPAYQDAVASVVGSHRGVPDISMSGSGVGPVLVYSTAAGSIPGWHLTFGTSESAPLFAAVVAIADQYAGHRLGLVNPALYRLALAHAPGIIDVVSGDNAVSSPATPGHAAVTVQGYSAGPGYDLATGTGTIDAAKLVPELAGRP